MEHLNGIWLSIASFLGTAAAAYMAYKSQHQAKIAARESTQANAAVNHRGEGQPGCDELGDHENMNRRIRADGMDQSAGGGPEQRRMMLEEVDKRLLTLG